MRSHNLFTLRLAGLTLITSSIVMFSALLSVSAAVAAAVSSSTGNGSICNSCNKFLIASSSTGFGFVSDSRASVESFYTKLIIINLLYV